MSAGGGGGGTPGLEKQQMRGSNNKVMGYFLIHRVLGFFAKHFDIKIEEREATTYLLGEVRSLQKVEVFDKVTLDYDLVYVMFDIFHAIGVINRVNENGQLFMRWLGYTGLQIDRKPKCPPRLKRTHKGSII